MLEDRDKALRNAKSPRDQASPRSFLGKLGFYEKFLEHRADSCAPLYALLRKDAEWRWTDVEEKEFVAAKEQLCHDRVLTNYSAFTIRRTLADLVFLRDRKLVPLCRLLPQFLLWVLL